jgi:AhpD family alkylhydroperoxidase
MVDPRMRRIYFKFYEETYKKSTIDRKTKELIAIAASLASHCKGCLEGHIKKALKYGATKEELSERSPSHGRERGRNGRSHGHRCRGTQDPAFRWRASPAGTSGGISREMTSNRGGTHMKRRVALALATTLLVTLQLAAQRGGFGRDVVPEGSRVEYKTFQSKLLNREFRYGLYLPVSYASSTKKYPVLYFLHGLNENEMRWSTRGFSDVKLDKMVADGKIGEFIVASVRTTSFTRTRSGNAPWEDMIVKRVHSADRIDVSGVIFAATAASANSERIRRVEDRHETSRPFRLCERTARSCPSG